MLMNHKISIIIPAYNVENYIARCLDSVLAQTYQNIEIIVINDGSTDKTSEILDAYAAKDSRIVVLHQKNAGLVMVREKGISIATGEYIGFVDGDDAVDEDMYERLLQNALAADAEISHCGLCVYETNGRRIPHYGTGKKLIQNGESALKTLLDGVTFEASLCNKLYKAELLFDSCLDKTIQNNEDLLRNFVLFGRASTVVFEDFCGYQYWSRENSMSNDDKAVQRNRQVIMARRTILENSSLNIYTAAKRLLLSTYVGAVNQSYKSKDPQMKALRQECRSELRKEKKYISYLIKRQQVAAILIVYVPWLHQIVYKIYDSKR